MTNKSDIDLKIRYARQIAVPEIGLEGQQMLRASSVLIIGCGALGSMAAMQLAGAGVGRIGIADFDNIDISNLQRQFFFITREAGSAKSKILRSRIQELNPEIKVEEFNGMVTKSKARELFREYDFIIDATDNPESKFITGEISAELEKPCCIGGVREFGGQVVTLLPKDPRFEEYFGAGASEGILPCSLGGVMGPAAAVCASIQVTEAIKYITVAGQLLSGKLLLFDLLNNTFKTFTL